MQYIALSLIPLLMQSFATVMFFASGSVPFIFFGLVLLSAFIYAGYVDIMSYLEGEY